MRCRGPSQCRQDALLAESYVTVRGIRLSDFDSTESVFPDDSNFKLKPQIINPVNPLDFMIILHGPQGRAIGSGPVPPRLIPDLFQVPETIADFRVNSGPGNLQHTSCVRVIKLTHYVVNGRSSFFKYRK